jgi:hypothetical protein
VFETEAAWQLPASYGDVAAEGELLRGSVALVDVTARGKIDVRGNVGPALRAAGDSLVARVAPDWAAIEMAPLPELVETIWPGGLGNQKAPRIQATLRHIRDRRGDHPVDGRPAGLVLVFAAGHAFSQPH